MRDIESKIKELLKIGYVKVDKEFIYTIARSIFKDKYYIDKFVKSEIEKGYIIGIICNGSYRVYSEEFIEAHDLEWFEMNKSK